MHGFLLVLQLLVYEAITALERMHRESGDEIDFTQRSILDLARKRPIMQEDIIVCDHAEDVSSAIHISIYHVHFFACTGYWLNTFSFIFNW